MKPYQVLFAFTLFCMFSQPLSSQLLDSTFATYSVTKQELSIYVEGQITHVDPDAIVSTEDSIFGDSIAFTIHFLSCQTAPTFMDFDTTFTLSRSLSPGLKHLKLLAYHDEETDSNDCRWNPWPGYTDTLFSHLDVPLAIESTELNNTRLFPNPVRDKLNLDGPLRLRKQNIRIFATSGESIEFKMTNNRQIDVTTLPDGIYFLQVRDGESTMTWQFTKNDN